jgi:hypothetical protein
MMNTRGKVVVRVLVGTALCLLACREAVAWLAKGHEEAAGYGVVLTTPELPPFFSSGVATIRHCSQDPDVFKNKEVVQLNNQEYPEHFIDLELLGDQKLPATRYEFIDLCYSKRLKPDRVGFVPYAVAEWTQRLTIAFAEYRKWPEDPSIQEKCVVYAGILSHYAADLCQPLHTTVDHDGRLKSNGESPRSGIHLKMDALIEKVLLTKEDLRDVHVTPMNDLMGGIIEELHRSHDLVNAAYHLEPALPALDQPLPALSPAAVFARERLLASARFTASLYLTAWRDSARITFPAWQHRPAEVSTSRPARPVPSANRPLESVKPSAANP